MLNYLCLLYYSIRGAFNSAFFTSLFNRSFTRTFPKIAIIRADSSNSSQQTQTNRNAICHYICQTMIVVIILQSCKLLIIDDILAKQTVNSHLINLLVHLCIFWWVLRLTQNGKFTHARTLLIFAFCSYVTAACLIWQFDVHVQYYFLLALFISSYLIDSHEKFLLTFCLAFQLIAFTGFSFLLPDVTESQYNLLGIAHTNTLIFATSCCICTLFIRSILSRNWQQLRAYEASQQQLINNVFPNHMGKQLLANVNDNGPEYLFQHKQMAILFLDICNFTQTVLNDEETSWQDTYSLFADFDNLTRHLDALRVKTNGDQYILVIGMQNPLLNNVEIAEQAIEASITIAKHCEQGSSVKVRQGLSFGEVIYGIFDTNNPVFDVWGETVVTAARLEAIAQANKILVDSALYQMTRTKYSYGPSINVVLKGIGPSNTYSVLM